MIRLAVDRRVLRQTAETLFVGAAGGTLVNRLGFPAGLISGSVLAAATVSLAGRPLGLPTGLTRVIFILSGIALGSAVSPETLRSIAAYPFSVAILALSTLCMIATTWLYLRFVHRWDPLSALLGASPGGLAQMMALSVETGADVRAIVVVQTVRVVVLTVGIPSGLALLGLAGMAARPIAVHTVSATGMALLVAAAVTSAMVLQKLRFPGGLLFGAMLGSGLLHGEGIVQGGLPWWAADTVMVALGTVNGSRFAGTNRQMLMGYVGAAFGSFAVSISITVCFALLAVSSLPVPPSDIVIAFSPGAQDTMLLLALALHLDPVFVGAHHLARFLTISLSVPFIARTLSASRRSV
ncbi:MAG TPA: AbrB family transcriptional regulator [Stellaceae bacterium]|nr:AbrB family transcriptional regulator [Stellaceae bacterium]